jgi:hypothetical protein
VSDSDEKKVMGEREKRRVIDERQPLKTLVLNRPKWVGGCGVVSTGWCDFLIGFKSLV